MVFSCLFNTCLHLVSLQCAGSLLFCYAIFHPPAAAVTLGYAKTFYKLIVLAREHYFFIATRCPCLLALFAFSPSPPHLVKYAPSTSTSIIDSVACLFSFPSVLVTGPLTCSPLSELFLFWCRAGIGWFLLPFRQLWGFSFIFWIFITIFS